MKKFLFIALASLSLGVAGTAMAAGDAAKGKELSTTCAACHGGDGNSFNPEWPKLAGQHAGYIAKQLAEFKDGKRKDPTMSAMAAPLSAEDMQDLAAYYSAQRTAPGAADEAMVAQGEAIYKGGISSKGVAACAACHGPNGSGNGAANFPQLSGQHAKYTVTQLQNFAEGKRDNDAGRMMRNLADKMNKAEMEAVAQYIQGLK
jgi:cytochrome c553